MAAQRGTLLLVKACCDVRPAVSVRQRRVLAIVLGINGAMFAGEFVAGLLAGSVALLADSLDMLGDALVYGFSLYVVARGPAWQARAALLKGAIMAVFGAGVALEAVLKAVHGGVPVASAMGAVGLLALLANLTCLTLLWRSRDDDLNMRSAWLCSRNDVVANAGVLLAAAGVAITGAAWPDVAVGLGIAALVCASAVGVLRAAASQLRAPESPRPHAAIR
jgi:cation diffusion facilitator family transporter